MTDKDKCKDCHKSAKEIAAYEKAIKSGVGHATAKAIAFDTKKDKK